MKGVPSMRPNFSETCRSLVTVLMLLSLESPAQADEIRRFARVEVDGKISFGLVEGERVRLLEGDIFGDWKPTETQVALETVRLLAPCVPSKVFGAAGNYRPADKPDTPKPLHPQLFFKSPTGVIGPEQAIEIPRDLERPLYEAELVTVIGKRAKDVPADKALEHVFGYTCGNDVSGGDWGEDVQWLRVKGCDTFAPCGPYIVSGLDSAALDIRLRVNGEVKQRGNTRDYHFTVAETVSFLSRYITLEPGDLIFMGTPPPVEAFNPGDVLEVEIEGIGVLRNPSKRLE